MTKTWQVTDSTSPSGHSDEGSGMYCVVQVHNHGQLVPGTRFTGRLRAPRPGPSAEPPVDKERWPLGPCESMFKHLAEREPQKLLAMIEQRTLKATLLGKAAECAGVVPDRRAATVLIGLLRHEKAHVREGAVYGLANHANLPEVRQALSIAAERDSSEAVRLAASEAMECAT